MADGSGTDDLSDRRQMDDQLRGIEWLGFRVMYAATGIIVLYALTILMGRGAGAYGVLYVLALLMAVLLAGTLSGGLLGFIFGIPRFLRQADSLPRAPSDAPATQTQSDRAYRSFAGNTNLEEISDWLTKIIVGIGLVQANKFISVSQNLTALFVAAANEAPGSGAIFVAVSITGVVGGFLFFYIQTRTRITLLLTDADMAAGGSQRISKTATDASINAPVRATASKELPLIDDTRPAAPSIADENILKVSFDQLKSAEEFGAWGAAQARAGNMQVAVKSLQEAISRNPNDPRYLSMLANVRLMQDDADAAIKALKEARSKPSSDKAELLRQELLTSLYLVPPRGFENALETGATLLVEAPQAVKDPMIQLWLASAYGQKYLWLTQNSGTEADLAATRSSALDRVRDVVRLEPNATAPVRMLLSSIYQSAQSDSASDNDLAVFQNDPEFEEAINGKPATKKSFAEPASTEHFSVNDSPIMRLVEDPD